MLRLLPRFPPPPLSLREKAANLAPLCVSRRLLSADAYRNLALARQGGNHVEAGLTFVADDDEDGNAADADGEEGKGKGTMAENGGDLAAAVPGEGAAAGAELGNDGGGDDSNGGGGKLEPGAGGGGVDGVSPEGAEDEDEDDLYGDLYGGLEDDGGGADMDASVNRGSGGEGVGNGTGGDGGGPGDGVNGAGGLDGGGVAETGADDGGDGMAEDVSTRAVMNALKVRNSACMIAH